LFEWRLEHCGVFISLLSYNCGRRGATQERESTHDNDDDSIKEDANANAFSFDFTHYQSWKSMKVVFFQMLGLLSFAIMWWRNEECGRRDTT
jgi:hypothetical protein